MSEKLSADAVERQGGSSAWAALVAIGVGAFALVTTEFLPIGLLPQIAKDMGITEGSAGLVVALSGLFAAIGAPLTIAIAGDFDRRNLLMTLLVFLLLSNAVVAFAPTFSVILIGRVLLGATIGSFWTVAGALGPRLKPGPQAGLATAIILSGVSLGTVAGVPAGALIGEFLGWRRAFAGSGALTLAVLIAVWFLVPVLPPESRRGLKDLADLLRHTSVQFGLLGTVLSFVGQFAGYTYITPFIVRNMNMDGVRLGGLLFGFGVAGVFGNLLGGWLIGKSVRGALVGTLLLLGTSLLALTVIGTYPGLAMPLILIWGLGFGMQPIVTQSWLFATVPDKLESVQAMFVSAAQSSIGAGALVGGLMFDHFGIESAMWFAAATAFVSAGMFATRSQRHA